MNLNSTNKIAAGQQFMTEGDPSGVFCLVLKGKVKVYNNGFSTVLGVGALLGAPEFEADGIKYSCVAMEEVNCYAFKADAKVSIRSVIASNKDYGAVTVFSHSRFLSELAKQYRKLSTCAVSLYDNVLKLYSGYASASAAYAVKGPILPELASLGSFEPEAEVQEGRLEYLLEYSKIPYDGMKGFFAYSDMLSSETVQEMITIEVALCELVKGLAEYCSGIYKSMARDNGLFYGLLLLASTLKGNGQPTADIDKFIATCVSLEAQVSECISKEVISSTGVEQGSIKSLHGEYLNGRNFAAEISAQEADKEANEIAEAEAVVAGLKGSFEQITGFCSYDEAKTAELKGEIDKFIALPDKDGSDDVTRALRKSIATKFYDLYEHVMLRAVKGGHIPKAVDLFLDFGFLSEKLLTKDELISLVSIKPVKQSSPCIVYTIREWLTRIYNGQEEPSRNDMGLDFAEVLRDLKKQGTITEEEEEIMLSDGSRKLHYEIKEVLFHGVRVVNGGLTTFVPMLHSGMFLGEVKKAYCAASYINSTVEELLAIDYSVFHREALYINKDLGIEKEYQMKQVFPKFILYPTVGRNVIVWQEITGKKRDTEGRFFVPAFSYVSLRDMMVKAFGQFRWSLCKTIQGPSWNNIQVHSLTSEYADYIQFYKKNKELSEERREKIKLQIQRGRNALREIFTIDYEAWIKSEANGAIRLNKVAREMLATYCPFRVEIRQQVETQPIYEEAFARFERERSRKLHELDIRYKSLENKIHDLPPELLSTHAFYRDM